MDHQPLVTVAIPNYNHEVFLKERIDSVLNQSFTDFEVLILDDCSSDDSQAVIASYQDHPKVTATLVNDHNSGSLFKQWEKAIAMAKGKYLWIAESDDLAHQDFLKVTVKALQDHSKAALVFTDSIVIDTNGVHGTKASETHKYLMSMRTAEVTMIPAKERTFDYIISDLIIWNASAVLFKIDALREVDRPQLKTFKNAGDLFTYLSLALKYDLVYLNKPLNYFRQHEQNTTQSNIRSGALHQDRLRIIASFFEELLVLEDAKRHLTLFLRRHFLTAVDHRLFTELKSLLSLYKRQDVISKPVYSKLLRYIWWSKFLSKTSHRYRTRIKQLLIQNSAH